MRICFGALLPLLLAIPGAAQAATGTLSGIYTVKVTSLCQSIEKEAFTTAGVGTTDQDQQTQIQTIDQGKISQTYGFIQFTPSKAGALAGTLTIAGTQAAGSLTVLGLPGPPATPAGPDMQMRQGTFPASYSMTVGTGLNPSSFVITLPGAAPRTYTAFPTQLKAGVYDHMDFITLTTSGSNGSTPSCVDTGTIDHQ